MAAIALNEAYNSFKTYIPHSNIDFWYGPYESDQEAKDIIEDNVVDVGLTVGIYTDSTKSKVKEKWFQKDEHGEWELVDKIEQYELRLSEFSIIETSKDKEIFIKFRVDGKGLNPVVSITNTNIQSKQISFGTEYTEFVQFEKAGTYTLKISVTDALGTKYVDKSADGDTLTYSCGEVEITNPNMSSLENLKPQARFYKNKYVYFTLDYNANNVEEVKLCLNDIVLKEFKDSHFAGSISIGETFESGLNILQISYKMKTGESKSNELYRFNVLNAGEFAIVCSEVPSTGYIGSNLVFYTTIQYGGPKNINDPDSPVKNIRITLMKDGNPVDGVETKRISSSVNQNFLTQFSLPTTLKPLNYDQTGTWSDNYTLRLQLDDDNTVYTDIENLIIQESVVKHDPYGQIYFNSTWSDVQPTGNDLQDVILSEEFPKNAGREWIWGGSDDNVVLRYTGGFGRFNFDICYNVAQDGTNSNLITIDVGGIKTIRINKQSMVSTSTNEDLGTTIFGSFQKEIYIPKDQTVHIGYGSYREENQHFYDCIFINGEIIYCTPFWDDVPNQNVDVKIYFSKDNSFQIKEFCFTDKILNASISSDCVNLKSGESTTDNKYNIIKDSQCDVFYYNWKTLNLSTEEVTSDDIPKLKLIPILNKTDNPELWETLRNNIKKLGKPIKKITNFCRFGEIFRDPDPTKDKPGITSNTADPQLFNFTKSDKEDFGRDKEYGVLCRYKLDKTNVDENKFCIAQVQGTSTLTYPVPNFQFTFIRYNNGKFELDNSVSLSYNNPDLQKEEGDLFGENESTILGETNLVAKADSMDSAHLNNTPTCIYFNSLVDAISKYSKDPILNNFKKFGKLVDDSQALESIELDAIVGKLISIEILEDTTIGFNSSYNFDSDNFKPIGTFMLNIGKSAKKLGMETEHIYSLEGQSNQTDHDKGSPGLFILPSQNLNEDTVNNEKEEIRKDYVINSIRIREAFNNLNIQIENGEITLEENDDIDDYDKYLISNFLISSSSFESRNNTIDDDDLRILLYEYNEKDKKWEGDILISNEQFANSTENTYYPAKSIYWETKSEEINNKWNNLKPFLKAWLFVNKADDDQFGNYFTTLFNLDYAILYYIDLLLFGQVDNLGKNMMLDMDDREGGDKKWYVRPYDLDSEFGLTNNGDDIFPVYGCISKEHFEERYANKPYPSGAYPDTVGIYNSADSILWTKFWRVFKQDIINYYSKIRNLKLITPEKIIASGKKMVSLISKEQYNIDFYLKYYNTNYMRLCKGGRFNNFSNWITYRFMYVDSYLSYFKVNYGSLASPANGINWLIGKTMIPTFYEAGYQILDAAHYWYGQFDYSTYNEETGTGNLIVPNLTINQQYSLHIVPEAVLYMSPMFTNLSINLFTNLQNYSGSFNANIFNFKNVRNIEFIGGTINSSNLEVKGTVRVMKMSGVNDDDNNGCEISFSNTCNIEELYIDSCNLAKSTLTISNLNLLRKLVITNSNINSLILSDLQLDTLDIHYSNKINSLSLDGSITKNKVLDLSGFQGTEIIIQSEDIDIEELYIDKLYIINNVRHTIYDDYVIVTEYSNRATGDSYNAKIDGQPINVTNQNSGVLIDVNPKIQNLNLSKCKQLKVLSCVGCRDLESLILPTSLKSLNIQFCYNLKNLGVNELADNDENVFDFSGLSSITSKKFYNISDYFRSASVTYPNTLYWKIVHEIPNTFNLMGCTSLTKIKNLNSNTLNNEFDGSYFVCGCVNLGSFENCKLEFKSLAHSFKYTWHLENINILDANDFLNNSITNGFYFSLVKNIQGLQDGSDEEDIQVENSSISCAFQDSELNGNTLLSIIKSIASKNIPASCAFCSTKITSDITGDSNQPIIINWTSCYSTFGIVTNLLNSASSRYFEAYCCSTTSSGRYTSSFSGDVHNINIKLPYATSVSRMFTGQRIKIENYDNIFEGNTVLTNISSFLAYTDQDELINFTNNTKITNSNFCYYKTKIKNINTNTINEQPIKFPESVKSAVGLFRRTDLSNVDVIHIFKGLNNLTDVSSCFASTNCQCSGNPFTSDGRKRVSPTKTIDISAMFWDENLGYETINSLEDISWTDELMKTSNESLFSPLGFILRERGGVFEHRIISNLPTSILNNGISQKAMFKDCTIENADDNQTGFTITATDAIDIFSGIKLETSFPYYDDATHYNPEKPEESKIQRCICVNSGTKVKMLSNGFYNISNESHVYFKISKNNIITDLKSLFEKSKGGFNIIFEDNETTLRYLENAESMFKDSCLTPGMIPTTLFNYCAALTNIKSIFENCTGYTPSGEGDVIRLNYCTSIRDMSRAFQYSGITYLPILPGALDSLNNMTGVFKGVNIIYGDDETGDQTYSLRANSLREGKEIFADSTSNRTLTFELTANSLKDVSGFSTINNINLRLTSEQSDIKALQYDNYKGGNIEILPVNTNSKRLTYTKDGWTSVSGRNLIYTTNTYGALNAKNTKSSSGTNSLNLGNLSTMGGLENPDSIDLYNPELEME